MPRHARLGVQPGLRLAPPCVSTTAGLWRANFFTFRKIPACVEHDHVAQPGPEPALPAFEEPALPGVQLIGRQPGRPGDRVQRFAADEPEHDLLFCAASSTAQGAPAASGPSLGLIVAPVSSPWPPPFVLDLVSEQGFQRYRVRSTRAVLRDRALRGKPGPGFLPRPFSYGDCGGSHRRCFPGTGVDPTTRKASRVSFRLTAPSTQAIARGGQSLQPSVSAPPAGLGPSRSLSPPRCQGWHTVCTPDRVRPATGVTDHRIVPSPGTFGDQVNGRTGRIATNRRRHPQHHGRCLRSPVPPERLKGEGLPMSTNAPCKCPTRPVVSDHLIVARGYTEWCQALRQAFAARGNFTIIVEGRHAERRRRRQTVQEERRRGERRRYPATIADPRRWPNVLVGQVCCPPLN